MDERHEKPLKVWVDIAQVLAGFTAVAALVATCATMRDQRSFNEDQRKFNEDQRRFNDAQKQFNQKQLEQYQEAAADQAFSSFLTAAEQSGQDRSELLANRALYTAERIFVNRGSDSGWRSTALMIVDKRRPMLERHEMDCGNYDTAFVRLVKEHTHLDPCRPKVR